MRLGKPLARIGIVLFPMFAAACGEKVPIVELAPNIFAITAAASGKDATRETAKDKATKEAAAYCGQTSRVLVPLPEARTAAPGTALVNYTLTFHCLAPDDPAVFRQRLEQTIPDIKRRNVF